MGYVTQWGSLKIDIHSLRIFRSTLMRPYNTNNQKDS